MGRTPESEGYYGNEPVTPEQNLITGRLWPISESLLNSLPQELRAAIEGKGIEDVQHPWEALTVFIQNLQRAVTENPYIDSEVAIPSSATIEGAVIIEKGARIEPYAYIIGPSWIASNATVHAFSRIRESYLGEKVRTGAHTELNRCVVGAGSRFHGSNFEDSVFGLRVTAGLLARGYNTPGRGNVRSIPFEGSEKIDTGMAHLGQFLGDGVFLAGNTTVQPGVKVGERVIIKSDGIVLYTDVPDNMSVSLAHESRQQLQMEQRVR